MSSLSEDLDDWIALCEWLDDRPLGRAFHSSIPGRFRRLLSSEYRERRKWLNVVYRSPETRMWYVRDGWRRMLEDYL